MPEFPCLEEARRFIDSIRRLYELNVNPRKIMRELEALALARDPRLPEAVRGYMRMLMTRRELMACTAEHYEEL